METTSQPTNKSQQLKAEIEARIHDLAQLTTEAARSEGMRRFLDTCARFHRYSPYNQMLIILAKPDASLVAGFAAWKRFSRYVRRGEKGIPILCPCLVAQDPEAKDSPKVLRGFRVGYVFDVSQTDGDPLPQQPDWTSPERNEALQTRLLAYAESKGIAVETKALHGTVQGTSSGGRIALSPTAGTMTLAHEIAHELLHQGEDRQAMSREERELEAEAVAYVIGSHFNLGELVSANYLALWDADEKKILARMDRIRTAAAEIIQATDPQADPTEA